MHLRHTADQTVGRQFAQSLDGINNVHVALEAGAIEIDRYMADQDITGVPVARNGARLTRAEGKRLVPAADQRCAADDGDPPLRERRTSDTRYSGEARTR